MSFRYHPVGTVLKSRIIDGNLEVKNPNGTISIFTTGIKEQFPWSRDFFDSPTAMFGFVGADSVYVGRRDGSWSAYTKEGLLIKMGNWPAPVGFELIDVGCYYDKIVGPRIAAVDTMDMRTIYIKGTDMIYVLNKPLNRDVIIPTSLSNMMTNFSGLYIAMEGGIINELESGRWAISSNIQWGDNRVPMLRK